MKFEKQFTDFLMDEAKYYVNGLFATNLLPMLKGERIDEETVRRVINPYLVLISHMLSQKLQQKFDSSLNEFAPLALDCMYINPFMHEGDETCLINEANATALLVTFLSFSCDLQDIHSEDLMIKELN